MIRLFQCMSKQISECHRGYGTNMHHLIVRLLKIAFHI